MPKACAEGKTCGLVLALHGCQYAQSVGTAFVDDAGINQWADTDGIIVLYPQAIPTPITNGEGWDWWGYLGDPNYAQKSPQMQALYGMVAKAAAMK